MKRLTRLSIVAAITALSLVALMGAPAGATIVGGGDVSGTVTITNPGCIPVATAPRGPVTYTFNEVVLQGIFANNAGQNYVGNIDVANVKGGSGPAGDNTVQGAGTVNSATDRATFAGAGNAITGNFYGAYQRIGSIVLVDLNVTVLTIAGHASNETAGVTVAAQFSPTIGDGFSSPVCAANFTGLYATA